jgi:hypothetical protein
MTALSRHKKKSQIVTIVTVTMRNNAVYPSFLDWKNMTNLWRIGNLFFRNLKFLFRFLRIFLEFLGVLKNFRKIFRDF